MLSAMILLFPAVLMLLPSSQAGFVIGKTPPAEFDMVELNGEYLPADAVKVRRNVSD